MCYGNKEPIYFLSTWINSLFTKLQHQREQFHFHIENFLHIHQMGFSKNSSQKWYLISRQFSYVLERSSMLVLNIEAKNTQRSSAPTSTNHTGYLPFTACLTYLWRIPARWMQLTADAIWKRYQTTICKGRNKTLMWGSSHPPNPICPWHTEIQQEGLTEPLRCSFRSTKIQNFPVWKSLKWYS